MPVLTFVATAIGFCLPAVLVGLLASALARRSHDEWKVLAWVPVLPLAVWGPWLTVAAARDPTSHNLWPFELAGWLAVSGLLFAIFLVLRRLFGRPRLDWVARRRPGGTA